MKLQMLKKAMISYVTNMGKAMWSAVAHPLTIKGKKSCNLIGYRMYGNSTQSGTPTPSLPKEIKSVGELVVEGENVGKYKISVKVSAVGKEEIVDIFLDEPLRKVGDYADTIDFASGTVSRIIKRELITKIASRSSVSGTNSMFLSAISETPLLNNKRGHCISNKFSNGEAYSYAQLPYYKNIIQTYVTSSVEYRVAYTFDGKFTLTEAQSLIGDGFEVCYVLAEPIEEKISLPSLPQFKGTTTYELLTETPPSGIEVCYYG